MKVTHDWCECLRDEAKLSLQVPTISISFNPQGAPFAHGVENTVDIDPSWVCEVKVDGKPAVGREEGFLRISRIGYEANKDRILDAYVKAVKGRYGFRRRNGKIRFGDHIKDERNPTDDELRKQFDRYAQDWFAKVKQKHALALARTEAEVKVRKAQGNLTPYWENKLSELQSFPV